MSIFSVCKNKITMNQWGLARTLAVSTSVLFLVVCTVGATDFNEPDGDDIVAGLVKSIPDDFPQVSFRGYEKKAQLLSHYLWYHLYNRNMANQQVIYNREYIATSDTWVANALIKNIPTTAQGEQRQSLLTMPIGNGGYVSVNQCFSHAHDYGWPFPVWSMAGNDPNVFRGYVAGWHFQKADQPCGFIPYFLDKSVHDEFFGETAAARWELENAESLGLENNRWHVKATGRSPAIITPEGVQIDAFCAPFLQLRWNRKGESVGHRGPYVEWLRDEDMDFGPDRRVYFYGDKTPMSEVSGFKHSLITMYHHPKWKGKIKRIRIVLAPDESEVSFEINSFFTVYDTRHSVNNSIFILASSKYFCWTGDIDFLRKNIDRMRLAMLYQQKVMGGLKYNRIRNTWPGHDGLPGWHRNKENSIVFKLGHGIGDNYWDILAFGWDDMYSTSLYYAATQGMADIEEAINKHPEWGIPLGALVMDAKTLRKHAKAVKAEVNRVFWNKKTGRFVACIDKEGNSHDYGFTFVNLESIWYGTASDKHARKIMDWITGKRFVEGDTSKGDDIYKWRFGPRATTKRNLEWYGQFWYGPESVPWGGQIQDGGAVLGFSFYDLWARLRYLGPENTWKRLMEILDWQEEVWKEGGYRKYYEGGKRGTTLQGCNAAGGIGIDCEFIESSLLPSIVTYGFLGLDVKPDRLVIQPRLPESCPEIGISNLLYRNAKIDIKATNGMITIEVKDEPVIDMTIEFQGKWLDSKNGKVASLFVLSDKGIYRFEK